MDKKQKVDPSELFETNIDHIPDDVFYHTLLLLPTDDIERVSRLDKRRWTLVNTERLWKALIRGDLLNADDPNTPQRIENIIKRIEKLGSPFQNSKNPILKYKKVYGTLHATGYWSPFSQIGLPINKMTFPIYVFPVFYCKSVESNTKNCIISNLLNGPGSFDTSSIKQHAEWEHIITELPHGESFQVKLENDDIRDLEKKEWFYERIVVSREKINSNEQFVSYSTHIKPIVVRVSIIQQDEMYVHAALFISYKGSKNIFASLNVDALKRKTTDNYFTVYSRRVLINYGHEGYLRENIPWNIEYSKGDEEKKYMLFNYEQRLIAYDNPRYTCSDILKEIYEK